MKQIYKETYLLGGKYESSKGITMVAVATVNLASVALLAQCSLMAEEAVISEGRKPVGLAD